MLKNVFFILLTLSLGFSTFALAGHDVGNGGMSWVCRNQSKIIAIELADLIQTQNPDPSTANALARLERVSTGLSTEVYKTYLQIAPVLRDKFFEPILSRPQLTHDFSDIEKPRLKFCKNGQMTLEQTVRYVDGAPDLIEVDPRLRAALQSSKNQSHAGWNALEIHESVYRVLRQAPYFQTRSDLTRKIVALMFTPKSETKLRKLIQNEVPGVFFSPHSSPKVQ